MKLLILCSVLFVAAVMSAQTVKKYDYKDFTGVSAGWGMQVSITQSDNYSVEVRADEEDLEYLEVEKDGDNLEFTINKNNFRPRKKIQIAISMPALTSLGLSGGAEGKVEMNVASKDFSAGLSGGSKLFGNLSCGDIDLALSGGSTVNISGKGGNAELAGSGGSIFKLKDFSAADVEASLSGGSEAKITMSGKLNVAASGGSEVTYYGNASLGETNFSGGSKVRKGN